MKLQVFGGTVWESGPAPDNAPPNTMMLGSTELRILCTKTLPSISNHFRSPFQCSMEIGDWRILSVESHQKDSQTAMNSLVLRTAGVSWEEEVEPQEGELTPASVEDLSRDIGISRLKSIFKTERKGILLKK
ncbi:hypothetical protein HS088_TW07G01065 [Tripterygium wilfordii]|uniref:Uncharacterized protein n=1 Tax=Tripterygium wilfordii TaxID=458696 RepID=A0A7J7DGI2_TRIWF|nr:hypothetical protein HS088_TW07G01065 [Tripterygium wilfordii]